MEAAEGTICATNCDLFIQADGMVVVNPRGKLKETRRAGTTGETVSWVSEYGSLTFSLLGIEYAWGGMNEAGLVASTTQLRAGEYPGEDERKVWWRSVYGTEVYQVGMDAFDFSCEAPMLYLNLKSRQEGKVEDAFLPCDSAVNLELFHAFCARWGIDVSPENAEALMEFFEGFRCAE